MSQEELIRHLQQAHDFTGWTLDTFRRQFPALMSTEGRFAFETLDALLHDPNAESRLIIAQMATISSKTCEACKVPLTEQEQQDYVSLCEMCASKIDDLTDERKLEDPHGDDS